MKDINDEISAQDCWSTANFCNNDNWEGIEHALRINFITNELKDQYQISVELRNQNIENPFIILYA